VFKLGADDVVLGRPAAYDGRIAGHAARRDAAEAEAADTGCAKGIAEKWRGYMAGNMVNTCP
jgi:hypothetical protein